MAKPALKSYIKEIHGKWHGNIYYVVKGNQYSRSYAIPHNPKTEKQQKVRCTLAEAVKLWQELSPEEKSLFNRKAEGKVYSGYNLFISIQARGKAARIYNDNLRILRRCSAVHAYIKFTNTVTVPPLSTIACFRSNREALLLKKPPGKLAKAS
ncbi:MAG TPA: hypothetical protein PKG60_12065 [Spirochaetota bacterium]|nr:hypothetical protein [Spirochaetota bacterium]HPS87834.1 hypothetical protein [Spirochaetota bacterium]